MKRKLSSLNAALLLLLIALLGIGVYQNSGVLFAIYKLNVAAKTVLEDKAADICVHDTARIVDHIYRLRFGETDYSPLMVDPECSNHPLARSMGQLTEAQCRPDEIFSRESCQRLAEDVLEAGFFKLVLSQNASHDAEWSLREDVSLLLL